MTYDGSSRAAGIRLYLDGALLETDVVRDHLFKDISYRREAGDRSADIAPVDHRRALPGHGLQERPD